MANYKRTAKKLQTALTLSGRVIRMNTRQFYSEEQKRMIDSYSLVEKKPYKKKDGTTGMKDEEIFRSCSMIDIVKFLSKLYKGGG